MTFDFSRCAEAVALLFVPVDLIIRLVSWTQFERVGQLEVGGDSGASMLRVVLCRIRIRTKGLEVGKR